MAESSSSADTQHQQQEYTTETQGLPLPPPTIEQNGSNGSPVSVDSNSTTSNIAMVDDVSTDSGSFISTTPTDPGQVARGRSAESLERSLGFEPYEHAVRSTGLARAQSFQDTTYASIIAWQRSSSTAAIQSPRANPNVLVGFNSRTSLRTQQSSSAASFDTVISNRGMQSDFNGTVTSIPEAFEESIRVVGVDYGHTSTFDRGGVAGNEGDFHPRDVDERELYDENDGMDSEEIGSGYGQSSSRDPLIPPRNREPSNDYFYICNSLLKIPVSLFILILFIALELIAYVVADKYLDALPLVTRWRIAFTVCVVLTALAILISSYFELQMRKYRREANANNQGYDAS